MIPDDLMAEIRKYLVPPEKPTTQCLRAKVYGRLLLDHIDAMAAHEAKLRELHRLRPPRWKDDYSQDCEHCFDGSYTQDHRTWPCATIRILNGEL